MNIGEIILLAMALSVDSMAVSLSGSVSLGRVCAGKIAKVSFILAAIQTLFLVSGYYAGDAISSLVEKIGSIIGFALLLYVGGKMIYEAVKGGDEEQKDFSSLIKIIVAGIATSIDAVACGASFGITHMPCTELWTTAALTFITTIIFAVLGMVCGSAIGRRFGRKAGFLAGTVLILIGIQLLI